MHTRIVTRGRDYRRHIFQSLQSMDISTDIDVVYTEDNLRQLHGIQESIQRMRQVSVQTLRLQVS